MSRHSIPRRSLAPSPEERESLQETLIPRRPVGASLSNRASQQTVNSGHISTTSTRVDGSPGGEESPRFPSPYDPGHGEDTEYLSPNGRSRKQTTGYEGLSQDAGAYEFGYEERHKSWRSSHYSHHGLNDRRSCMYHLKAWGAEVAWCVLALVLLGAIVGILMYYEDEPEKRWFRNEITLNTVIAFVATLCRAALVIPIAECISQLKWNSFASGTRPLMDLHAFDQASRGPWGSMLLLFKTRGRLLGVVTVAALIVVSGLVTSPTTQATIDYQTPPEREEPIANLTRAISLDGLPDGVETEMKRAALRSMFTDGHQLEPFKPEPHCPSLECRWEPFEALDICSVTHDITDRLNYTNIDHQTWLYHMGEDAASESGTGARLQAGTTSVTRVTIENIAGHWLMDTSITDSTLLHTTGPGKRPGEDFKDALKGWQHENMTDPSNTFLGGLTLAFAPEDAPQFNETGIISDLKAIQVLWYWCVSEHNASIAEGRLSFNTKKTSIIPKRQPPGNISETHEKKPTYRVPGYSEDFIGKALSGGPGKSTGRSNEIRHELWSIFYPDIKLYGEEPDAPDRGSDLNAFAKNESDYSHGMKSLAESIAMAMGNVVRQIDLDEKTGLSHNELRNATASVGQPVLRIRWAWLSLLGTQVVFTFLFLTYVVINTAILDVEIVKSSNIAELLALNNIRDGTGRDGTGADKGLPDGIYPSLEEFVVGKLRRTRGQWGLEAEQRHKSPRSPKWRNFRKSLSGLFEF